jgi:hypothetical protein
MFAPFVIPSDATVGDMATVHWGNVDTGAMVNVVYLGVTRVFQYLQKYWIKYEHVLYGVGGKRTRIVAMLKDVPVIFGSNRHSPTPVFGGNTAGKPLAESACHTATFLVVDNDDYHWILGIPLLAAIDGMVKCRERTLEYTPAGATSSTSIQLITRTEAKMQPVRTEFRQKSPHLESEAVEEASWEATTLHQEEIDYVGEGLTDILGRHYTLQDQGATHVSHSQAAVLNPAHPSDGAPLPTP